MSITLHEGDSYVVLRRLIRRGVKVASVCCDPPYALTSIVKRFGKKDSKAAKHGRDGAFARTSAGFMGQTWDAQGVERDPEFWKLVNEILLPGGYIVAFSSARTYHHMAVAIEAAGFITHPMIGWCYASGLPKGHRNAVPGFEGHRHGAQARKPALEPIYVGQKPFSEKSCTANMLKHGVGAVDIEGLELAGKRYPSNLITDGSAETSSLFPPDSSRFFEAYPFDGEPLIYHRKANKDDRAGLSHATVKPIGLMRSLVRHVTPEGMTTLDPFAGTGTTGIAAEKEGRSSILIEAEPAYAEGIRSRLYGLTAAGETYIENLGII